MSQSPPEWKSLLSLAEHSIALLQERKMQLALAESCTGGLLAALLTSIAGASSVFQYGWVCYSAAAKKSELALDASLIASHGVVSQEVAAAMAAGALKRAHADIAISATGNAGPSAEKGEAPVGRVYLGFAFARARQLQNCCHKDGSADLKEISLTAQNEQATSLRLDFPQSERNALRLLVCEVALQLLIARLEEMPPQGVHFS